MKQGCKNAAILKQRWKKHCQHKGKFIETITITNSIRLITITIIDAIILTFKVAGVSLSIDVRLLNMYHEMAILRVYLKLRRNW